MSHVSTTTPSGELSDRVVALLRTAVPTLWGTVVAWALARLAGVLPTDLADALGSALQSEAAVAVVVLAAVTAWYALWRWAEPHVPAWLVRIVLGSARTPVYGTASVPTSDGGDVLAACEVCGRTGGALLLLPDGQGEVVHPECYTGGPDDAEPDVDPYSYRRRGF